MLKFDQYLMEGFGALADHVPPEVAKFIATKFRLAHNIDVTKFTVDNMSDDVEMQIIDNAIDLGDHFPVVLHLANDDYMVFSVDPIFDEESDPDRQDFFEGEYDVFHKGKHLRRGYGVVNSYRGAKAMVIFPSGKGQAIRYSRALAKRGDRKSYAYSSEKSSPLELLYDAKVEEINKAAGMQIISRLAAQTHKNVRYEFTDRTDNFKKAFMDAYGFVPKRGAEVMTFGGDWRHVKMDVMKYDLGRLNKLLAAIKKHGK